MRKTTFKATHESYTLDSCVWTLAQTSGWSNGSAYEPGLSGLAVYTGLETEVFVNSPGRYQVGLSCSTSEDLELQSTSEIQSLYIRRELRELLPADRELFLDTFQVLMQTSTSDGQRMYGANYHSLDHFVLMHLDKAGARVADKIHDGMGVVTQHVSITSMFERSLQSVQPSVTIPYWDYTIDAMIERQTEHIDGHLFRNSKLWGPEWFGHTSGEGHMITDGRFAYSKVTVVTLNGTNTGTHSPYGYARAPWNMNPSPYITRFHKMCGMRPEQTYLEELKDLTDYKVHGSLLQCPPHLPVTP